MKHIRMNPKLNKRCPLAPPPPLRRVSTMSERNNVDDRFKTSVRDQAALLLSIMDIASAEIDQDGPSALWKDTDSMPKFPVLSDKVQPQYSLLPVRPEPLSDILTGSPSLATSVDDFSRIRSVSLDYSSPSTSRTSSPLHSSPSDYHIVSPGTPRTPIRSLRLSHKARKEYLQEGPLSPTSKQEDYSKKRSSKPLQGTPKRGVPIKTVYRKKFSWKNYPELEAFLVANREEYLRHSALNYTLQQKQYNNRLTERLLELATRHGYMFDEAEFAFVTVRDRIRCYFKSYVQSAKKRGVLMGYAARKAGLLTEDDLERSAGQAGLIVTPMET